MSIGVRVRVSDCSIGDGCFDNGWMRIYHEGGFKAYWIRKYSVVHRLVSHMDNEFFLLVYLHD